MACLALTLCYIPYIFEAILAYVHFACFLGLIVVNIFVKDAEPGQGNRTRATRVLWLSKFLVYKFSNVRYEYRSINCRIDWRRKGITLKPTYKSLPNHHKRFIK